MDEKTEQFIDELLKKNKIDIGSINYMGNEEKFCTLITHMISKCVLRIMPMPAGSYVFSTFGREIMSDKQKRTAFVEKFEDMIKL